MMRRTRLFRLSFGYALSLSLLAVQVSAQAAENTSTDAASTPSATDSPAPSTGSKIGSGASMTEMELYTLYAEASRLHDQGKLDEAYTRYAKVWAQNPGFDVAASMADIELRREQFVRAATNFHYALEHMPVTQNKRYLDTLSRGFRQARQRVGEVALRVQPAVDDLTVCDARTGECLAPPLFLSPGTHTLKLSAPGYQAQLTPVTLNAGETTSTDVRLQPLTSPVEERQTRFTQRRQPQWVFPIGGVVTGSLAAGAVAMSSSAGQHRDELRELDLGTSECRGRTSVRCSEASRLADAVEQRRAVALALGLGAVAAAGATVLVWWLWEVEVPVEVALMPASEELKVGWTYAF